MSHSIKRNADEAFSGQGSEVQNKRPRRRHRKASTKLEQSMPTTLVAGDNNEISQRTAKPTQALAQTTIEAEPCAGKLEHEQISKLGSHTVSPAVPIVNDASPSFRVSTLHESSSTKKRKQKRHHKTHAEAPDSITLAVTGIGEHKKQKHDKKGKRNIHESKEQHQWKISSSTGGTFLNIDPIVTQNNEYLLVCTRRDVQVYSTQTSLLVRSIPVGEAHGISTYCLSRSVPGHLFVGLTNGGIVKYDWTTGHKLRQWNMKSNLLHLSSLQPDDGIDLFLVVVSEDRGACQLLQVELESNGLKKSKVLLEHESLQPRVVAAKNGSVLTAFCKDEIFIARAEVNGIEFENTSYEWRSFKTKGRIVSFDTFFFHQKSKGKKCPRVDITVGLQNGVIMVYTDIMDRLFASHNSEHNSKLTGRRLHWHRNQVRAVKWSRDGNYLISGGDETVLVIWQLDTNQKQFLPHLTTAILNIAISQSGAHYALRLGDNSVMVLSTADLTPSTNITGLSTSISYAPTNAMLLHPIESNRLLSAVSTRSVGWNARHEATHLQTYDLDAGMQISRQALTRNLTTVVNVGPNGQPLFEPDVVFMSVSSDGKWLATVEEWCPDPTDLEPLYINEDETNSEVESVLRIWSWNSGENNWEPMTRIDQPHSNNRQILSLVAHPSKAEFSTTGIDGSLKIWTPKSRLRDGIVVKDRANQTLYTWSCSQSFHGEKPDEASEEVYGAQAYSRDGTVLAVCWSSPTTSGLIYLIDRKSAELIFTYQHSVSNDQMHLDFCGRYLVVLSNVLAVVDTITMQTVLSFAIDQKFTDSKFPDNRFLAVSPQENYFAVGANCSEGKKSLGRINIFDINTFLSGSSSEVNTARPIKALLAETTGQGFVIIDADASIQRLENQGANRVGSAMISLAGESSRSAVAPKGMREIFGGLASNVDGKSTKELKLLEGNEQTRPEHLDELFNSSTGASNLRVEQLFEQVAKAIKGVNIAAA